MVSIPGVDPALMWGGFISIILFFLIVDLSLLNKKHAEFTIKKAVTWTIIWIAVALAFNSVLFWLFGKTSALEFFGGYVLEYSLSIDNLFVIFLIFQSFRINKEHQHTILFWGIMGVIILRGLFIILGTALVSKFHWMFYVFGIFLIYSGIQMFMKKDDDFDPHDSWVVRTIHRFFPVSKSQEGGHFFVKENGRTAVTLLFVALVVVEFTDVVFAFDSIPAILGITTDPFIVFSSNIFAILGLRSLYFVIAKLHDMFIFLKEGLSIVLVFIGAKMVLADAIHVPLTVSLAVVFGIIIASIGVSLAIGKRFEHHKKLK